jgi:hypothetical protein
MKRIVRLWMVARSNEASMVAPFGSVTVVV